MINVYILTLYPNLSDKIVQLNELIIDIGNQRLPIINPKNSDGSIMPKIVWKFKMYMEIAKHRIYDFSISVCEECNLGNIGAAFVLTRCIFENEVYIFDVMEQLKKYINEKNFAGCNELIFNRLLGVKIQRKDMPIIPNVLTMIDKLNKVIPGFKVHYDQLCEFSHPNYFAMMHLYAEMHHESNVYVGINRAYSIKESNIALLINSLIPSLKAIKLFLEDIDKLYPALTELSNDDEKKKV